jgi:hypothetical protein
VATPGTNLPDDDGTAQDTAIATPEETVRSDTRKGVSASNLDSRTVHKSPYHNLDTFDWFTRKKKVRSISFSL